MTNPLSTEESFTNFVSSLCCNGCKFFIEHTCTEENKAEHNNEKEELLQEALQSYINSNNEDDKYFADNINNYYMCEQFEAKEKIS